MKHSIFVCCTLAFCGVGIACASVPPQSPEDATARAAAAAEREAMALGEAQDHAVANYQRNMRRMAAAVEREQAKAAADETTTTQKAKKEAEALAKAQDRVVAYYKGTLGKDGDTVVAKAALNVSTDVSRSDIKYGRKFKLSNLSGLYDWSRVGPSRNSAGIVGTNTKVNLASTRSGGTFPINGTTYQQSDVGNVRGRVKAGNRIAPYFGFGYGNVAGAGVNLFVDVGAMFQGSPKATLADNCDPALNVGQCAQLQNYGPTERQRVEDNLNKYKNYPVATIGVSIGF